MNIRTRLEKLETVAAQVPAGGLTCVCPLDPSKTWADESPIQFAARWSGDCPTCRRPMLGAEAIGRVAKAYGAATGHHSAAEPG